MSTLDMAIRCISNSRRGEARNNHGCSAQISSSCRALEVHHSKSFSPGRAFTTRTFIITLLLSEYTWKTHRHSQHVNDGTLPGSHESIRIQDLSIMIVSTTSLTLDLAVHVVPNSWRYACLVLVKDPQQMPTGEGKVPISPLPSLFSSAQSKPLNVAKAFEVTDRHGARHGA